MATITLGTTANNSLTALLYNPGRTDADIAAINNLIKNDANVALPLVGGAFVRAGLLIIPNRGQLIIKPGDYVGVDAATGWPILVSGKAIASGPWTHS